MALGLDAVLDKALGSPSKVARAWEEWGFLRNPFPSQVHPIWEVFHDQEEVRDRFFRELQTFLTDGRSLALFFTGGNRVGKTHFMRHHQALLERELPQRNVVLPVAVLSDHGGDLARTLGSLTAEIDESYRRQTGSALFERPLRQTFAAGLDELPPGDMRSALQSLWEVQQRGSEAEQEEQCKRLRRWMLGERIRAPERKLLGVRNVLASAYDLQQALRALIVALRLDLEAGSDGNDLGDTPDWRSPGVLLFLDEFELVWNARRDRRDAFLQGLRAILDDSPTGFFLCVGMATGLGPGIEEVERTYPALFARLQGDRTTSFPALKQIGGVVEALGYSQAFIEFGRERFKQVRGDQEGSDPAPILAHREIESAFRDLAGSGSVAQGEFLHRLHELAEARVSQRSP